MQVCIKNNKKMEKEKYYTPTIEEFHVGFEYEEMITNSPFRQEADVFIKRMFSNKMANRTDELTCIDYDLGSGGYSVRVKHLDREDIESFGFELIEKDTMESLKLFRQLPYYMLGGEKSNGNGLIVLQHDWLNDKITMQTPNYIRDGSGRFDGYTIYVNRLIIKNKSEFSRLLKQLSII